MTFTYSPNEGGDPVLHVKALDGDKEYTIPLGAAPGGAGGRAGGGGRGGAGGPNNAPSFSDDSHWAAYLVNPPGRAGGSAGRGRGGPAQTPGGRGAAQNAQAPVIPGRSRAAQPRHRREELDSECRLVEIFSRFEVDRRAFQSSAGSRGRQWGRRCDWRSRCLAAATPPSGGADLILRDLATGIDHAIGNVNQYEFDDAGKLFAYTVDAAEKFGNGVYVLDPATGVTRALSTGAADYDALAWSNDGANLAALRGDKTKEMKQRENALLAWSGLGKGAARRSCTIRPRMRRSRRAWS